MWMPDYPTSTVPTIPLCLAPTFFTLCDLLPSPRRTWVFNSSSAGLRSFQHCTWLLPLEPHWLVISIYFGFYLFCRVNFMPLNPPPPPVYRIIIAQNVKKMWPKSQSSSESYKLCFSEELFRWKNLEKHKTENKSHINIHVIVSTTYDAHRIQLQECEGFIHPPSF